MKKIYFSKKGWVLTLLTPLCLNAQVLFTETYSSTAGWTSIPATTNEIIIQNGKGNFNNSNSNKWTRIYKVLSTQLKNSGWSAEMDFYYSGNNGAGAGHGILGLTKDTVNPDYKNANFDYSNNDMIAAVVTSDAPSDTNNYIFATSKRGTTNGDISTKIPIIRYHAYKVKLERLSSAQGSISVYEDGKHIPKSPQLFSIDPKIDSLRVVQHWAGYGFSSSRYLSAYVDNLIISNSSTSGVYPDAERMAFTLFPNPSASEIHLKGPLNPGNVVITDLLGRILLEKKIDIPLNEELIDINNFPAGTYMLQYRGNLSCSQHFLFEKRSH